MNQEVSNRATSALGALSSLRQGLQNVRQSIVIKGGDPFLRLLRDGEWVYGQDNNIVEPGSMWAVNPMSLMHGFISWKDSEPVGEIMVPMTQPLPDRFSLHNTGAEWDQQISWMLRCVSGEDEGTQVLYKATSVGAMNAANKLIAAISAQLDDDPEHPVPAIQLLTDNYPHKKWGKIYVPVFVIARWLTLDGVTAEPADAGSGPAQAPEPAPEPAKRTRRTKAQIAADAAAEQKPAADSGTRSMSLEEMEAAIARAKAERDAPQEPEDPLAARRRELEAELAKLAAVGGTPGVAEAGEAEPGQPIRRRRA